MSKNSDLLSPTHISALSFGINVALKPAAIPRLRAHVIVGPTGVGKTALAERLAKAYASPIVVADRIQCFTDLTVTSARTPSDGENGVPRYYPAQRCVADGDLSPREAATSLAYILGTLATQCPFVVIEGGSISLLRELFNHPTLPFDCSVDVRRIADLAAHRQNLFQRAREMLVPNRSSNGLLEELAAAWMIEPQHNFISSVNGLEAVVAWCKRHQISPAQLERAKFSEATLIDLAHAIADAHLVHVHQQVTAFQELFRFPTIRHVSTEALLTSSPA